MFIIEQHYGSTLNYAFASAMIWHLWKYTEEPTWENDWNYCYCMC